MLNGIKLPTLLYSLISSSSCLFFCAHKVLSEVSFAAISITQKHIVYFYRYHCLIVCETVLSGLFKLKDAGSYFQLIFAGPGLNTVGTLWTVPPTTIFDISDIGRGRPVSPQSIELNPTPLERRGVSTTDVHLCFPIDTAIARALRIRRIMIAMAMAEMTIRGMLTPRPILRSFFVVLLGEIVLVSLLIGAEDVEDVGGVEDAEVVEGVRSVIEASLEDRVG